MKEQLISFETAKLAKEKGYKLLSNPFGYITKFYNHNTGTLLAYGRTGKTDLNKAYYASTQSLLQKWLREVHNLDVIPNHYGGINFPNTCYNCYINKHLNTESKLTRVCDTYEEALEVGLLEGLKLIKDVI